MPQTLLYLPLNTCSWKDSCGGLVVLWLRLHAPNAGGPGLIPDRRTRSHTPQLKILHAAARRSSTPQLRLSTAKSIKKKYFEHPWWLSWWQTCLPVQRDARDAGSIPESEDPLEKEMATHSSILAWRIQRTEEPGRLQFMGSQKVGHNLVTKQQNPVPLPEN